MGRCPNLRNTLEWLSFDRQSAPREIWWIVGIAAMLGALYGIFVHPLWSDAVEVGQVWAGLISYKYSTFESSMLGDPSLQITIPALLLLLGVKAWPLSLACTAFFCVLSFSAVAAASFALTRNTLFSIALPLLLLSFDFSNSHGYPVVYPVHLFQFGQTGMYFAVLALSLAACGWPLAAGFIGGLLAGVHTVWFVCFLLGVFPAAFWFEKTLLTRLSLGVVLGAVLSAGFLYYGNSLLPPHDAYQPPFIPRQISAPVVPASKGIASPIASSGNHAEEPIVKRNIRGTFSGHNVLFADASSPLKAALEFFLPEAVFILLVISLYFIQSAPGSAYAGFCYGRRLIVAVAIPVAITAVFKIYEEMDPHFAAFGLIDKRLPPLVLRAILNRWLNLTNVLIPIMGIALMAALVRKHKSWQATFGLFVFAVFVALGRKPDWYIGAAMITGMIAYRIKIKQEKKEESTNLPLSQLQPRVIAAVALCFIILKISVLAYKAYEERRYTGAEADDAIVRVAQADSGPIIISNEVLGAGGLSYQLRMGRSVIVPDQLDVYDRATSTVIHTFCYTDSHTPIGQFYGNVRSCFENRPAREWSVISEESHATGMIIPENWKLQISPVISAGGFSYYRFAQPGQVF